tara:strand:- start:112 stop:408 length:297 start_codon:yes stop_codon:yes gene_type:complete
MRLIKIFKSKKIFFLNIFLFLYVAINLIGGERGLVSYFEKKNLEKSSSVKLSQLTYDLNELENKNRLLSVDLDLDYIDTLYREKLKFGKKDEILIKIK